MACKFALVQWQEEGKPLSVISLRAIEEPILRFDEYASGTFVKANFKGYPGIFPAQIVQIGEDRKELDSLIKVKSRAPNKTSSLPPSKKQKPAETNDEERALIKRRKFEERKKEAEERRQARASLLKDLGTRLDVTTASYEEANNDVETAVETETLVVPDVLDDDLSDTSIESEESQSLLTELLPVNAKGYVTVAQKQPRGNQATTNAVCSSCLCLQRTLDSTNQEVQILKCRTSHALPKPGKVSPDIAAKYKMVELMPDTGVYLYQHDLDSCIRRRALTKSHGKRVVKLLMNKFWSKDIFPSSTLSVVTQGKRLLDTKIVDAIIDFAYSQCMSTKKGELRQAMASKLTSSAAKYNKNTQ